MTYQLRRLRLHGLIVRQPGSHRYRVTDHGLRVALFFTRSYARVVDPGMSQLASPPLPAETKLQRALAQVDKAIDDLSQNLTQKDDKKQHSLCIACAIHSCGRWSARRHLTESQRVLIAARLKPLFEEEARQRQVATQRRGNDFPVGQNFAPPENTEKRADRPRKQPS